MESMGDEMAGWGEFASAVGPETIKSRARQRAIIELLIDKGIFTADEFSARYDTVMSRDGVDIVHLIFGPEAADQAAREGLIDQLRDQ